MATPASRPPTSMDATSPMSRKPEKPEKVGDLFAAFEGNRNFVMSFARGLEVIQSFNHEKRPMSVAHIARKCGLSRAAVRRFLITLELLGYVENVSGSYHLKASVLKLGSSYLTSTSLPAMAQPLLEQVSNLVHESASLSTLDGNEIIYLARHTRSRVISVGLSVGSRLPAYCTSMGRVLLAGLPPRQLSHYLTHVRLKRWTGKTVVSRTALQALLAKAANDGYALVDGELELGLRSIAVPVRAADGEIVAAMNVGAHAAAVTLEDMQRRFLPILLEHAQILSRLLQMDPRATT